MRILFPAFAVILLAAASCSGSKKKNSKNISRFNWLNGSWLMKEDSTGATEEWMTINDTLMEGRSANIKGDSIIPFETVRLYKSGNDFIYEVKSASNATEPPVPFKLTAATDTSFVVENPQHDFPKRIGYTLVNKDSVYAFIDDGTASPENKMGFSYRRQKN